MRHAEGKGHEAKSNPNDLDEERRTITIEMEGPRNSRNAAKLHMYKFNATGFGKDKGARRKNQCALTREGMQVTKWTVDVLTVFSREYFSQGFTNEGTRESFISFCFENEP